MEEAIEGLTELLSWTTRLNVESQDTGSYVAGTILLLGLLFVVYALARKKDNAFNYLLVWCIAVFFTIIVFNS